MALHYSLSLVLGTQIRLVAGLIIVYTFFLVAFALIISVVGNIVHLFANSVVMQVVGAVAAILGVMPIFNPLIRQVSIWVRKVSFSDTVIMNLDGDACGLLRGETIRNGCLILSHEEVAKGLAEINERYKLGNLPSDIYVIEGNAFHLLSGLRREYPEWKNVELHIIEKLPASRRVRETYHSHYSFPDFLRKIPLPQRQYTWVKVEADLATCFYKIPILKKYKSATVILLDDVNRGGKTMKMLMEKIQAVGNVQTVHYISFAGGPIIEGISYLKPHCQVYESADADVHFPWERPDL